MSWSNEDTNNYVIGDRVPIQLLNPNQFYKICPDASKYSGDEAPICGDGSEFCFFFSKPSQKNANRDKLLIEVMGGGACWDAETCEMQEEQLYVNEGFDNTLGKSCQELQYGMQNEELNMLCASQLGGSQKKYSENEASVDFREYNSLIVPYCTQDIHLGSNTAVYYENGNNDDAANDDASYQNFRTVHHKGGNNLQAVVKWVFRNFPDLRHAALTGCSAGGTALPVMTHLLHNHYNHFGVRDTQVSSILNSPVYLTPSYFLKNGMENWNPQPILSSIGINYDKYRQSEQFASSVWDFILRKETNKNRWGFVSHTDDPVSLIYYQYMSGNGDGNNNNDDGNYNDNYNNGDDANDDLYDDINDKWYSELTSSVNYVENRHKNVKTFWIDGEGHCSFGLYYPLQEDGFSSFAASVYKEDPLITSFKPAVRGFLAAAWMGTLLLAILVIHRIRRQSTLEDSGMDDDIANDIPLSPSCSLETNKHTGWAPSVTSADTSKRTKSFRRKLKNILVSMDDYPVTAGYTLWITVYFVAMISSQGFAHPVNNPAFGPSAVGLSVFGINNPSLIIYKHQWFRMVTSNFLVSGVLTLFMAYFYLWRRIRKLEERMTQDFKSPWLFVTIIIVVATIINATYCLVPQRRGASTAAIPLLIGLQTFHLTFYWNSFVRPYLSIAAIVFDTILVVTLFSFNSWVMIVAAIITGWMTAKGARTMDVWLPGPMMNVLKQNGISLELGSLSGDVSAVGPAAFGTALSFPPCQAASESEYNNFDGNLSNSYETMDDQRSLHPDHTRNRRGKFLKRALCAGSFAIFVLLLVPLFLTRVAKPNENYLEPFQTGCKSFYTVDIEDLSESSFLSSDDDERRSLIEETSQETSRNFFRWLAEEDQDGFDCAEFCVPHLVVPFVKGILRKRAVPIQTGRCSNHGYSTHVLDKTFTALSYSLDVELYAGSNNNGDEKE